MTEMDRAIHAAGKLSMTFADTNLTLSIAIKDGTQM